MDRSFSIGAAFPLETDSDGNIKHLQPTAKRTDFVDSGAIILALRCSSSAEAHRQGGDQTIQFALSLEQVRGLLAALQFGETVLQSAATPTERPN